MLQESFIPSFDGVRLFTKIQSPDSPKAVVVIVHGLCEHQGRYDYLTGKLLAHDCAVYRFDHRGHGRSNGIRVYYAHYIELIDDVNTLVELAQREHPDLPLFLIGHSMGGYGVACYGTKYPGKVRGIVISGGLTRDNGGLIAQMKPGLDPLSYVPNALGGGVCSDAAVVAAYERDTLVEKQISVGLFYAIHEGVQWLRENPSKFVDPVLLLHGCCDGLVSEKDSRDFYGDIASADKSLRIYAKLYHEIFNEPSRDQVIGDAIAWINLHI